MTGPGQDDPGQTKRPRIEQGDAERLAKIHSWLAETDEKEEIDAKKWREMQATVNGLSLEALHALLDDPGSLADEITGYIDDAFPIHAYPLRFEVRLLVWQRYAELAPDAALASAFPDGKPTKDQSIQIEDILFGVAKADPMRAFEAWQSYYSGSGLFERVTRMPVDSLAQEIAAACAKENPAQVAAQLAGIGKDMRHYAYQGYASSLGEGTDWAAEVARLEELFPDPAQRRFQSQHPTCSLITSWAKSDPAAAFAWMQSLEKHEDGSYTAMGYHQVIAMWMQEQPTESVAFLKEWDAPVASRDQLFAWVLKGYGSRDSAVTVGMLELIGNPAQREEMALKIIQENHPDVEVLRSLETSKRLSSSTRQAAAAALLAKGK